MRKIGIFGGTFNPIHNGHLHLVDCFKKELDFDKVLLIPTNIPPHKENMVDIDSSHRVNMCNLAVEDINDIEVSKIEFERDEKSYTYVTVSKLKEIFPTEELYLIMGSDMFFSLEKWYRYDDLKKLVVFCVAAREENEYEKLVEFSKKLSGNGAKTKVLKADVLEISSSEIRQRVMLGEDYESLVPNSVFEYIKEHNLYNLNEQIPFYKQLLKSSLSEKRYIHSLNVADSAVYLASKYGTNKNKAYFAGLMHDITKEKNENEQLQIINDFAIIYDDAEKNNKALWHAITGAWYLENVLKIKDTEIINAVRWHTEFRENATLLDKIIYLADFISADRDYKDVDVMRQKCENSLDEALLYGLSFTIKDNAQKGRLIGLESIKAYNSLLSKK